MRSRRTTLRGRVALIAVLVLAGWVIVLTTGLNVVLRDRLAAQADSALQTRAQAVAATVTVATDGKLSIAEAADDSALDLDTWIFARSNLVEEPVAASALRAQAAGFAGSGPTFLTTDGVTGNRWFAQPIVRDGAQIGTVVTVTSLAPYGNAEKFVLVATIVLAVLLLLGAYLALRAGVGIALRPVDAMTNQAARWSADDEVEQRFGATGRPAELEVLAETLDHVLDRIAAVLRRERELSAEISHELRTPLARLAADLDVMARHPHLSHDLRSTVTQMTADVDELADILQTLLNAARPGPRTSGWCDADAVLRTVTRRWQPAPAVTSRPGAPVVVGVDAAVLQRMVIPILDNAVRHASTRVVITINARRGSVVIEIADDGPGIHGIDPAEVFDPGRRGTSPTDHRGAGLGLSLAHRLVTGSGGTIRATTSGSGAVFIVSLPAG